MDAVTLDALTLVRDEVRDSVRRNGVDPVAEPDAVRALVDASVRSYRERSLDGSLPPLDDTAETTRSVYEAVAGLGALQRYFDDPEVEEIWVNAPGRVFVARQGRSELTTTVLGEAELRDLVERMLKWSGRRVDVSSPFVDATLPDGSRLHVVIPDITARHWAVNVRKFVARADRLDDLVALGTLSSQAARFLEAAVVCGLNVIVAGGTQAGKTTTLGCLLACVPAGERIVSCEEVFELRLGVPDWVALQTRQPSLEGTGEVRLRRLVTEALRMRPSRLVVGEVRQEECLDLLVALNSGVPGMCTIHANSAREAVTKLCTLPLLAGDNVGHAFVVPTVAASVDLVLHVATRPDGRRRLREIVALPGRAENGVVEVADVFTTRAGRLVRADGYPPHTDRFADRGYDLAALLEAEPEAA